MPLECNSGTICPLSDDRHLSDHLLVYSRSCLLLFEREITFYQYKCKNKNSSHFIHVPLLKLADWYSQKFQNNLLCDVIHFYQLETKSFGAVVYFEAKPDLTFTLVHDIQLSNLCFTDHGVPCSTLILTDHIMLYSYIHRTLLELAVSYYS